MSDIVDQLRNIANGDNTAGIDEKCLAAAQEIERLQGTIDEYASAGMEWGGHWPCFCDVCERLRACSNKTRGSSR